MAAAQTQQIIAIVIIIALVIYCSIMGVLTGIAYSGLIGCETTESPNCPSFYCRNQDVELCKGRPFRYDTKGTKECQFTGAATYATPGAATTGT
jgi:hypothetical protein